MVLFFFAPLPLSELFEKLFCTEKLFSVLNAEVIVSIVKVIRVQNNFICIYFKVSKTKGNAFVWQLFHLVNYCLSTSIQTELQWKRMNHCLLDRLFVHLGRDE